VVFLVDPNSAELQPMALGRTTNAVAATGVLDDVVVIADCDDTAVSDRGWRPDWAPDLGRRTWRSSRAPTSIVIHSGTYPIGNGQWAFTEALLAGLAGGAADPDGNVTARGLAQYLPGERQRLIAERVTDGLTGRISPVQVDIVAGQDIVLAHVERKSVAPGLHIEEVTTRPRSIEGVGTATTVFIGPTLHGPIDVRPELLTSLADFERTYGGSDQLRFVNDYGTITEVHNYMWHATRAFFQEGGERLYVSRVHAPSTLEAGDNDGMRPSPEAYSQSLARLETLDDVSIVAAPGCTFGYEDSFGPQAREIVDKLLRHAERMRYRFAIVDSGNGQSVSQVRAMRAELDSRYGALYYPWVRVLDPLSHDQIDVPPSGFVAGIYARTDRERGVFKVPANQAVRSALGFEYSIDDAQQEVLNPQGINCFRSFEDRGMHLWGARTISSDPEWKYVNVRRYASYLQQSIDLGTRWATFEPNDERLWAAVRGVIDNFLLMEWKQGGLVGDTSEKAYFVKCDRTTMTQDDIDNSRLICLVGVAIVSPTEFVTFRITQHAGPP
jgi:phage tail sheath protein FI